MKNALRYQDSSDDEMPGLQEEDLPSDADAGDDLPDLPDDLSLLSDGERDLIDEALEQLKAEEELKDYDWIIFLDADAFVVDTVQAEELFTHKPFIGVHHPCHYLKMTPHNEFPGAFETDEKSQGVLSQKK